MGLASRLTHALVLTDLIGPRVTLPDVPRIPVSLFGRHLLGSFNGLEPGGTESTIRK